jgi:hypothetical protein
MHKNVTKCNETLSKWCKNKHGASKIIDKFETYQGAGDDDDDDNPDEAQLDDGDDGDNFPPPGRNFPGRFLPAGELSLSVCFPPRRGGGVFLRSAS